MNIEKIISLLVRAGIIGDILIIGGWIYTIILLIVLLYKLVFRSN
ncbi:hypothetical protein [Clostridium felsineum]|nr:hypothetical protein [Clostridium felsineum]